MKAIPSILTLLLASGAFLSAGASDWVEGPATEFSVTKESLPTPRRDRVPESTLPRTDDDDQGSTVVGVTDKGGPMKPQQAGMKPIAALQGGVSRWQPGYGQPTQWKGAAADKYSWAQDLKT